ncbi:Nitrate reductase (NADH) [Hordeum vulgare]|nr:Nitrate reductase (NADH) [Hordeum vulgare]
MDGCRNDGDNAERRERRRKRGARRWLNYGSRPPSAFEHHELDEYEREFAVQRRSSVGSSAARSSSAGASRSRITPVKREPEELGPLVVKLEADEDLLRRGVIGPEDYLAPGQEDHLVHVIMESSMREAEEADACIRRELKIEMMFLEQAFATSQAHTSKEADLCVMKAEQAKV